MITLTTTLFFLALTGNVMAATSVSQMALDNGGQAVAECSKAMDKGISECVNMPVCNE
jgi:hypothetical protein